MSDHFVAMTECHFMNPQTMMEVVNYYPNAKRWWKSVDGVLRAWTGPEGIRGTKGLPVAETLVRYMDEAEVDVDYRTHGEMIAFSGNSTCAAAAVQSSISRLCGVRSLSSPSV